MSDKFELVHYMDDEPFVYFRLAAKNYREANEEDVKKAFEELCYQVGKMVVKARNEAKAKE